MIWIPITPWAFPLEDDEPPEDPDPVRMDEDGNFIDQYDRYVFTDDGWPLPPEQRKEKSPCPTPRKQ